MFLIVCDCLSDVSVLEGNFLAHCWTRLLSQTSFLERKSSAEEFSKVKPLFGRSVNWCLRGVPQVEFRVRDIDEQRVVCNAKFGQAGLQGRALSDAHLGVRHGDGPCEPPGPGQQHAKDGPLRRPGGGYGPSRRPEVKMVRGRGETAHPGRDQGRGQ